MFTIFIRTLLLYVLVVIVMRIMGKRQIGQLQPFELAIAIMISELASVPMQNPDIPLLYGIIPIFTLLLAQISISFFALKSTKASAIICGKPRILIENGIIKEAQLKKEMYTIHDLLEQLRITNTPNIADVEFAILETNGQLSVIPKSQKRAITAEDLNIPTKYEGIPLDLIIDGNINYDNMKKAKLNRVTLQNELNKLNACEIENIFFASIDSNRKLYWQKKELKK